VFQELELFERARLHILTSIEVLDVQHDGEGKSEDISQQKEGVRGYGTSSLSPTTVALDTIRRA
jgi:hypothetical protein